MVFSLLLFWNLSQDVPARECVCIPVVLLNQTGLQHSILFLDSRLPFLSCKKYSSVSGWQAISFYKCVRPRFFHLSLSFSFYVLLYTFLFWGKGRGGTRVRVLIHALNFSVHRSLASHGSFIFCTRLLTQLCLLSAMGELFWCIELKAWEGAKRVCCWTDCLSCPLSTRPQNTLMWQCYWEIPSCMVSGYSSGIKLVPGAALEDLFAINLYRSADFYF